MKNPIKEATSSLVAHHLIFLALVFMVFAGIKLGTGLDLNSWAGTCLILICGVAIITAQVFFGVTTIRVPDYVMPDPAHEMLDSGYGEVEYAAPDPWEMQRRLMVASDQPTPAVPTLSNNSVLYGALIMEEGGETFCGLAKALEAHLHAVLGEDLRDVVPENYTRLRYLANRFAAIGELNQESSRMLREMLKKCDPFTWEIPEERAVEMFDGSTDLAVVNAGLAIASGFPGQWGYNEVARSNLSKRNPETGKIDKTADGKWIKGANYFEPNLAAVLQRAREEAWIEREDDHQWGQAGKHALVGGDYKDSGLPATAEEEEAFKAMEKLQAASGDLPLPTRII